MRRARGRRDLWPPQGEYRALHVKHPSMIMYRMKGSFFFLQSISSTLLHLSEFSIAFASIDEDPTQGCEGPEAGAIFGRRKASTEPFT